MDAQYDKLTQQQINILQVDNDNQSLKNKSLVSFSTLKALNIQALIIFK